MSDGMQRLMFGRDRDPGVMDELVGHTKNGAPTSNPMILAVGKDPADRTCRYCAHLFLVGGVQGRYWKCDLRRQSGGPATDHRVGWPACARYEDQAP